jgi:hypothetical protein
VFASLEANQYIYYAKGFDGEYIIGKTLRRLNPGSLLFLSGNTLHAGTEFKGNKDLMLEQLNGNWRTTLSNYASSIGDLKIFYDVSSRAQGHLRSETPHGTSSTGNNNEQEWVYEAGNKYNKNPGYYSGRGLKKDDALKVCLSNDASGDRACSVYIEENL